MSDEIAPVPPLNVAQQITDEDVVKLARAAMEPSKRAEAGGALPSGEGITLDLTHKNIKRLPDEVIDIIKDEIERLAISHNRLVAIPPRLAECKRLRYLNVRSNFLNEVPKPILQLLALDILDLSRNRIRVLPESIGNLTSLKVLSISGNRIQKLPLCIGDLERLALLKFDNNPLTFPPPQVYAQDSDLTRRGNFQQEEAMATEKVKKFLKQQSNRLNSRERSKTESDIDNGDDIAETPRPQPRGRGTNGRYITKPSNSNFDPVPKPSSSPEWQMMSSADPMPPIPARYENNAPQIPPRSQHRYGPTSKSGPETRTLLSPPDSRGPLTSLGNYQSNASSDSLSKGYRSASIITPRMANHPAAQEQFSTASPATVKPPKTSYLIGKEGSIIGQFEQADYANVEGARRTEVGRRSRAALTKHLVKAAFSIQIAMLEQSRRLQFLEPSFDRQGSRGIIEDVRDLVQVINVHGEDLSALLIGYDHNNAPTLSAPQIRNLETSLCNLLYAAKLAGLFYQKYMSDIWALGQEIMRMQYFLLMHGANEIAVANASLAKAYSIHEANMAAIEATDPNTSRPSTHEKLPASRDRPQPRRNITQVGPGNFKFPASPPTLNEIGIPGGNQKLLTSPTEVPNMFINQEFVNAGATGKDGLLFLQICKALQKMLSICVEENGLIDIREYYRSMTEVISVDSHFGPRSEKARGFNRLAHGANDCYEKMHTLSTMMSSVESRGPLGTRPDFWLLVRDAVSVWFKLVKELKSLAVSTNPEIKQQMKDIHSAIKAASSLIRSSPWGHYMTTEEVIPLNQGGMAGRETLPVAPHTKQSSLGSVPTTPLGAALGPAAAAAIPSRGGGSRLNVFERADRYLANPGPFRKDRRDG